MNTPLPLTTGPSQWQQAQPKTPFQYKPLPKQAQLCSRRCWEGWGWRGVPCLEGENRMFGLPADLVQVCLVFLLVLQLGRQSHSAAWKIISGIFTGVDLLTVKLKEALGLGILTSDITLSEAVTAGSCFSWKKEILVLASNNKRA